MNGVRPRDLSLLPGTGDFQVRWLVREKKGRLPYRARPEDRRRFANGSSLPVPTAGNRAISRSDGWCGRKKGRLRPIAPGRRTGADSPTSVPTWSGKTNTCSAPTPGAAGASRFRASSRSCSCRRRHGAATFLSPNRGVGGTESPLYTFRQEEQAARKPPVPVGDKKVAPPSRKHSCTANPERIASPLLFFR